MRPTNFRFTFLAVLITQFAFFALGQTPGETVAQPSTPLELRKPIARELKGGEEHSYSINIDAGQFAGIVVDQRGIDVLILLFAPDGKKLAESDSPNGARGRESVSLVAETSGSYRLEVRSLEKTAAVGRYEVNIVALRDSNAEDIKAERTKILVFSLATVKTQDEGIALLTGQPDLATVELAKQLNLLGQRQKGSTALITHQLALVIAEKLGSNEVIADSLYNIGNAHRNLENFKKALEFYGKSLEISRANGNALLSVRTLNDMATVYRVDGRWVEALEAYKECLQLRDGLGDKAAIVRAMLNIAFVYRMQGDFDPALDFNQRAMSLSEVLGDKALIAQSFLNLGVFYRVQSNFEKSLEFFGKELKLREELGTKPQIAAALNNLGTTYRFQSDYRSAIEHLQRSLRLYEEINDKAGIADVLSTISDAYRAQGRYELALENLHKSLKLHEGLRNKAQLAYVLHRIGMVYSLQGNYALAMSFYERDLKLRVEIGSKSLIADTLNTIGNIHNANKDYALAADYYQRSVKLQEQAGSKRGQAIALGGLGDALLKQGRNLEAMATYQRTLEIGYAIDDKSIICSLLVCIGEVYLDQGDFTRALDFSSRGASVAKQIGEQVVSWNGRITMGLAYRELKDFDKSRQAFDDAIGIIESLRSNVSGLGSRASFFATVQKPYESYIDLLMHQRHLDSKKGYDALAFQLKERWRARSLLEALNETHADIRQGVDVSLLERETNLRKKFDVLVERQTRLLFEKQDGDKVKGLENEIGATIAELEQVESLIRKNSPRYVGLTKPASLTVREIQNDLLDSDTALLEYSLGDERSYLWLVTQDSLKSYELPKRSDIEASARRVSELLINSKRWAQDGKINAEYAEAAGMLSDMLLAPVTEQIKGKRLVIVADGALQYIPFSALPIPQGKQMAGQKQTQFVPMAVANEIVGLPSASTLAVLRREAANRKLKGTGIAIVADPVFSETDERLANARVTAPKGSAPAKPDLSRVLLERAFSFSGESGETFLIPRLPFTRREAESIFASAPKTSSLKALDFAASRDAVMGRDLSQYRIIHFATHGILHGEHPELSGIVLSLVNEKGEPVNGFLRLNEIYNMNLNADLVVLSACQTALGKEVRGEGLIGLTRGFMYAGSPRVVASLWKVDDVATAELMKVFYQKMLKEKMRPAAALRAAKIAMYKTKRWNAPYYWAAFELQGEWR